MCRDDLPALLGGPAVCPQGPPAWPLADPDVAAVLHRAAADGSWGRYHSDHGPELETHLRELHGVEHVLLCGSGTFAVELGLRALKVGPGDEVILASYDFPGNFLGVHAVGATPVLIDVAADNWNLSLAALDGAAGPATRAVIASHLHGGLVPMRPLTDWARARGIAVLEDAAQAPGALVQRRRAGTWGDVGTLSFGGSKLLSAGRGGALLTARADVWQRAHTYQMRGNLVCPLSELQAAVLLPQLLKLDARNEYRQRQVERLHAALADLPGVRPFRNHVEDARAVYYKVGFQFDAERFGLPRPLLVAALRAEGIAVDEGFGAAHRIRSPRRFRRGSELSEAERAHHGAVILHHPVLLGGDVEQVARAWRKVHQHAEALRARAG
jgi:dTDP-4-amino-4,6-dideoxygalactose transaminase